MSEFTIPAFIAAPSKFTTEHGAHQLSTRTRSGELVRVRRGLYLPTEVWQALTPWQKYRVQIQAVQELAQGNPVFARESAAQILGLPLIGGHLEVQTLFTGARPGGQSSNGVRRLQSVEGDPEPWLMQGLLVTPPHITARDLAVRLPLTNSLPAMDSLLSQRILPGSPQQVRLTFGPEQVAEAVERLPNQAQRVRALRVLSVADGRSGSAGESWSRAIMIERGFPPPALQMPYRDDRGLIGYPDFEWREFKLLGEFDGFEKYSAQRFLKGRTPSQVVVGEKLREDRLRALGFTVVRWVWDDLKDPARLVNLLCHAGLRSLQV